MGNKQVRQPEFFLQILEQVEQAQKEEEEQALEYEEEIFDE